MTKLTIKIYKGDQRVRAVDNVPELFKNECGEDDVTFHDAPLAVVEEAPVDNGGGIKHLCPDLGLHLRLLALVEPVGQVQLPDVPRGYPPS